MKKILSAVFLTFLCLLQAFLILQARPVLADESFMNSQEGFKGGELATAFGNEKTPDDIRYTAARLILITLSTLGIIFLVLLVVAGFKYMTAAGNEDQVKTSLKQITQAVIGLLIILLSWSITYFIMLRLRGALFNVNYLYPPV